MSLKKYKSLLTFLTVSVSVFLFQEKETILSQLLQVQEPSISIIKKHFVFELNKWKGNVTCNQADLLKM